MSILEYVQEHGNRRYEYYRVYTPPGVKPKTSRSFPRTPEGLKQAQQLHINWHGVEGEIKSPKPRLYQSEASLSDRMRNWMLKGTPWTN